MRPILFVLFFLFSCALTAADFQIWESQILSHPLCKNVQFQWETQTRFQQELIHVYTQENLVWRISEQWDASFNYRNSWTKAGGRWHPRRHPIFDFTRYFTLLQAQCSFRNRFFINLDSKDFVWRGRALFEIPLNGPLYFVTGDELFLRTLSSFFENRVLGSLEWRFCTGASASIGYIWRLRRHDTTNILAFRVVIPF